MKKITRKKLEKIVRKNRLWFNGTKGGKRGVLIDMDLSEMDLKGINFDGMYIENVSFNRSDLTGASFRHSNITDVSFVHTKMESAIFNYAIIEDIDFYGTNLKGAYLYNGTFVNNCFPESLYYSDLTNAKGLPPTRCPEKGSFTAFKKAYSVSNNESYIVELFIPARAKRTSALSSKCRADIAKVVSITTLDGEPTDISTVRSWKDKNFIYTVGEYVSVDDFEDSRWIECGPGIHFFMSRQEAVDFMRGIEPTPKGKVKGYEQ